MLLYFSRSEVARGYLLVVLMCFSPMADGVERLLACVSAIGASSSVR